MDTVLVHTSDRTWTMQALHYACTMARTTGAEIVLLQLIKIKNPGLLGASFAVEPPDPDGDLHEYEMVAEDYGVPIRLQPMLYESTVDALAQASEALRPVALFAHLPTSRLPLWARFQRWRLCHRLDCPLHTLEMPVISAKYAPPVHEEVAHPS